jgi:uncharacterized membrane protein
MKIHFDTKESLQPAFERYSNIDFARGVVMILMALDHARDFLGKSGMNPRDPADPALFLTRWFTHFCAPTFVFLAGVSAWLYLKRHGSIDGTSKYLLLRGLWLIFLEFTLVRFSWTFDFEFHLIILQVIWVLGFGMIFLSQLIKLPLSIVGGIGILMILGHNLLDPIQASWFGDWAWLWNILHSPATFLSFSGTSVMALYSLIPWVGVMAFGFAFGHNLENNFRCPRFFLSWGAGCIALFVMLRLSGIYGDPQVWHAQAGLLPSLLSFVNCEKYPPSLQFLLMTLGPLIGCLPLFSKLGGPLSTILITFGRVPLFFYLLHLPLIHLVALGVAAAGNYPISWMFGGLPFAQKPAGYGLQLWLVYVVWIVIISFLYPLCREYSLFKAKNRGLPWSLL